MTVLAIDLGTTGLKVVVVERDGTVVGTAGAPLPTIHLPGGGAEQDAEGWWTALGECARAALEGRGDQVEAVAGTTQWMSIIAIDERGLPLMNTVMWMDGRGVAELRAASDVDLTLWLDHHGHAPLGPCDQAHIAHIRAARPDVYERTA